MIDRRYIERVLKLNGLSETAPDEEIRSVLISARWDKQDVETAITVLRENINTHASRIDTFHDVFLTDKALSPEAISSLLGINVDISSSELQTLRAARRNHYYWQLASIFLIALCLACSFIFGMMYLQSLGPFHPGY